MIATPPRRMRAKRTHDKGERSDADTARSQAYVVSLARALHDRRRV
jgi:hypothetical protein